MKYDKEVLKRVANNKLRDRIKSPEEAARLFTDGMVVGMSGFTPTGYPKVIPLAVADRVKAGEKLGFYLETGASVGSEIDGVWAQMGMIRTRLPYQTDDALRDSLNRGEVHYMDMHLSHAAQMIRGGAVPKPDIAVIEAAAITNEGGIIPPAAIGNAPSFVREAKQVIIELNVRLPETLFGMADIVYVADPPNRLPIGITHPADRIGTPVIPCDPDKISAIVISDRPDRTRPLRAIDNISEQISEHIIAFLKAEVKAGRLPENLRPLQSGVGSVANAVFAGLAKSDFTGMTCYTEVIQDSMLDLIRSGKILMASSTAVSPSPEALPAFERDLAFLKDHIILRPQEISNNPEVIRRLGVLSINTGLEIDLYGNVNSTHLFGSKMVNGIGGSGDFARNAALSIFATQSVAKGGDISSIVPMVSHVDHTEHDVMVVVTEQGLADLRGLSPRQRAEQIIKNCAHPSYKGALQKYFTSACASAGGQTPHDLAKAFSWYGRFQTKGSMREGEER